MHDLKYPGTLFANIVPSRFDSVLNAAKITIFEPAAAAFKENMEQVRHLAQMPEFVVRATAKQITFDVIASLNALGEPFPTEVTEEQYAKLTAEKERMLAAMKDDGRPTGSEILASMNMLTALCSVDRGHEHARIGVESLLISMLLQGWTAFESFITDVWVTALNNHPERFAKKVAGSKAPDGPHKEKFQEKSVPLTSLERFGFDLTKSMGFLLKDKFDFDRLKNVEVAYASAFGDDAKELFDTDVTDCANVAALEMIRNLFAHRGGKLDQQFRIGMKRCKASQYHYLKDFEDGKRLLIDTPMVQDLLLSVCVVAERLLIFVKRKTNAPISTI